MHVHMHRHPIIDIDCFHLLIYLDSGEPPSHASQEDIWQHRSSVSCREAARSAELYRQDTRGASPQKSPCLQKVRRSSKLLH